MFGSFVREKRLAKGLGLREFCAAVPIDCSYWSKVERELVSPPQTDEMFRKVVDALGLVPNSKDWNELKQRAVMGAGRLPESVMNDKELLECLPIVFRPNGAGRVLSRKELVNLADKIRNSRRA